MRGLFASASVLRLTGTRHHMSYTQVLVRWLPPPTDWIKWTVDGFVRSTSHLAACGGVSEYVETTQDASYLDFA